VTAATAEAADGRTSPLGSAGRYAGRYTLQLVVVVGALLLVAVKPGFASVSNVQAILTGASFAGLIACGETLLIACGMIDLSVAGLLAVCAVVAATVVPHTLVGVAALVAMLLGALLGAVNGLVVTRLRIPPFIATLATMNVFLALSFIWSRGKVEAVQSVYWQQIGTAKLLGVPVTFLAFLVVCVVSWVLLARTHFGRSLRALGSNEVAARMAGIRVERTLLTAFVVAGLFTGVAAVMLSAVLSSAGGTMATGIELNAIAIAVVGGTSLRGGSGTLLGTFTAALLFAGLDSGLNLLGVPSYWQYVAVGGVLVAALALGARRQGTGTAT